MIGLANRAVACPGWRWLPGMLTQHGRICGAGYLVPDDVDEDWSGLSAVDTVAWDDLLPDLRDPATLGGLLALVREAWGDPYLYVFYTSYFFTVSRAGTGGGNWLDPKGHGMIEASTEAEALVAALEAAP